VLVENAKYPFIEIVFLRTRSLVFIIDVIAPDITPETIITQYDVRSIRFP
jgi:hypothetical protein